MNDKELKDFLYIAFAMAVMITIVVLPAWALCVLVLIGSYIFGRHMLNKKENSASERRYPEDP